MASPKVGWNTLGMVDFPGNPVGVRAHQLSQSAGYKQDTRPPGHGQGLDLSMGWDVNTKDPGFGSLSGLHSPEWQEGRRSK